MTLMDAGDFPVVSIIIPVKPGGHVKALESVKELDYPPDSLEVLVAEGCQPSRQRNEAVKVSKGEILYFLDDDSCPEPQALKMLAEHFRNPDVAVAGGPSITPESDIFLQRCFADIFVSPMGGAGIRNRYRRVGKVRETTEKELILCNLAFRADVYKKMGGLNERLYPNEENELMSRIKHEGLKLIHDPDIFVYRSQRKTLLAFVRQVLNYGRGRMEQTILYPASFSLTHFIPLLFLLYCIGLIVMLNPYLSIPLVFYFFVVIFYSLKAVSGSMFSPLKKLRTFFMISLLFPIMHLSYAAGMMLGIMRFFSDASPVDSDITIKGRNLKKY